MSQRHACPNGHQWEVEGEVAAPVCPTCGQTALANGYDPVAVVTVGLSQPPPTTPTSPLLPGYESLEEVGRGGMGVVYKARDNVLDRVVALKVILAGEFASEEGCLRLRAEAMTVARVNHPNVVAIHQLALTPTGVPFFVMEYCGGGTLAQKAGKPWPARDAAALVETLARAVASAHENQIIHRDLKPGNVLFTEDGTPKIADFGLARRLGDAHQTASGAIMGTPAYMAPEQAAGKTSEIGPLADVWALGAILYELLVGKPPFPADGAADTLVRILSDEPAPPRTLDRNVPRDLETIALKCLQKEPAKRYASAKELADDLRRYLDGEPIAARPSWALSRRKRGWLKTGSIALLGAMLAVVLLTVLSALRYREMRAYDQAWKRYAQHRDKKEYDEAAAALTTAHRLRPNEADPLASRAWVYVQLGENDLALEDYAQALKRNPRHQNAHAGRGHLLLSLSRYQEAVADLTQGIETVPDARLYSYRGNAYLGLQRFAEAEADLDRALASEKPPIEAYHARAIARAAQGRYADCLRDVDVHAERGGSGLRATAWFSHAAATLASGDEAKYRAARDRLLALADATGEPLECVLAARACCLPTELTSGSGRLERLVETGLQAYPENSFYLRVRAMIWLRGGRAEDAVSHLEAASKRWPDYSPGLVRLLIALAHHKLGHKDDARRAYEQALEDGIPISHVHETLEYQVLLSEVRKTIQEKDERTP